MQEVRKTHSQPDREELENPEALMAFAKAEADRVSEEAKSQLDHTLRQIEEEKTAGRKKTKIDGRSEGRRI